MARISEAFEEEGVDKESGGALKPMHWRVEGDENGQVVVKEYRKMLVLSTICSSAQNRPLSCRIRVGNRLKK